MLHEVADAVKEIAREYCQNIHTAMPGRIEAVTADGKVNVRPYGVYKMPDGQQMEMPVIPAVPVYMYQGGGITVNLPVAAGDSCLLIFCENELDAWLHGQISGVERKHSLSNAVALPGLAAGSQAASDGTVTVKNGSTALIVSPSGVQVRGNLTVSGSITAGGPISPNPKDE